MLMVLQSSVCSLLTRYYNVPVAKNFFARLVAKAFLNCFHHSLKTINFFDVFICLQTNRARASPALCFICQFCQGVTLTKFLKNCSDSMFACITCRKGSPCYTPRLFASLFTLRMSMQDSLTIKSSRSNLEHRTSNQLKCSRLDLKHENMSGCADEIVTLCRMYNCAVCAVYPAPTFFKSGCRVYL